MTASPSALVALRSFVDPNEGVDETRICTEGLLQRLLVLSDYAWERRIDQPAVERWLENFDGRSGLAPEVERLHALYLLSQFLYFGVREIRVLLHALYRDLFLIPLIQEIRKKNGNTRDPLIIEHELEITMRQTRFMGVGNPSESGVHLLYYFRQENGLRKQNFMDTAQIFSGSGGDRRVTDRSIERYIFLDDVCGSGETACTYSTNILEELKAAKPEVQIAYHCIFATEAGLRKVREHTVFGEQARAIFELDTSYRCLAPESRYFKIRPAPIKEADLIKVALSYGQLLAPGHAGGYNDGQLLLGFSHNIPDNALPIIWRDPTNGSPIPWTAALRRYMKV
jgi:hypothetical protein